MTAHRSPVDVLAEERRRIADDDAIAANDVGDRVRVAVPEDGSPRRADIIADLVAAHADLWRDPSGVPYATITVDGRRLHVRTDAPTFGRWAARLARESTGSGISPGTLTDARLSIEATCIYDRPAHDTHLRVAEHEGALWIDLGDESGDAVHVTANGWRIIEASRVPVRFLRPASMRPLPRPVAGGSIGELRPYLNIAEEHGFVLAVAWLVAALRPGLPFPIAVFAGEQGCGKSTASRILRSLTDPNLSDIRSAPKDEEGLFVAAQNAHVLALDNLSGCPGWLSDGLCRVATGGGFAKRALYTDGDESVIEVIRPIILNGIDDMLSRSDLAERALVIGLRLIPEADRREEGAFWRDFEAASPRIFGALLTGAAGALARIATVQLDRLPRMADFARWATAAEPALGLPDGAVMEAHRAMRIYAVQATIDASPVASAVCRLLDQPHRDGRWEGAASALLDALGTVAGEEKHARNWPRTAHHMARDLNRVRPSLREIGIVADAKRTKTGSWVTLGRNV